MVIIVSSNCVYYDDLIWFVVFIATFSNISALSRWPVLVVAEARVSRENHRPRASNWYTLSLATASRVHPFSSPGQRPCELLASVVRHKLSHLNLLLRNHWANCSQTLVELCLDGPLPTLFPLIPTSHQYGRHAKNRNFNCPFLLRHKSKWAQILTAATWQGVV